MFDRERGGAEDHVHQQGHERRFRLGECGDHEEQVQQEVVQAQRVPPNGLAEGLRPFQSRVGDVQHQKPQRRNGGEESHGTHVVGRKRPGQVYEPQAKRDAPEQKQQLAFLKIVHYIKKKKNICEHNTPMIASCHANVRAPARLLKQVDTTNLRFPATLRVISKQPSSSALRVLLIEPKRGDAHMEYVHPPTSESFFEMKIPFVDVDSIWLAADLDVDHAVVVSDATTTRFEPLMDDCVLDSTTVLVPASHKSPMDVETQKKARRDGLVEYESFKTRIRNTHGAVLVCGSVMWPLVSGDWLSGNAFLCGGVVGAIYLALLEKHVDQLGAAPTIRVDTVWNVLVSPLRVVIVAILSAGFIQSNDASYLVPYAIGFFTYKAAVVLVQSKP